MTYTELQNSPELTLAVHFVGEADQVTQLFPQNILRGMGYPLDIQVILKVGLQWQRLCYTSGEARKTVLINSRRNSQNWVRNVHTSASEINRLQSLGSQDP